MTVKHKLSPIFHVACKGFTTNILLRDPRDNLKPFTRASSHERTTKTNLHIFIDPIHKDVNK